MVSVPTPRRSKCCEFHFLPGDGVVPAALVQKRARNSNVPARLPRQNSAQTYMCACPDCSPTCRRLQCVAKMRIAHRQAAGGLVHARSTVPTSVGGRSATVAPRRSTLTPTLQRGFLKHEGRRPGHVVRVAEAEATPPAEAGDVQIDVNNEEDPEFSVSGHCLQAFVYARRSKGCRFAVESCIG